MIKKNRGFTLFEMLVVLAIIAIMVTLVLARYRGGETQYQVAQAAQRFASDLREAQVRALSGVELSGYAPKGYGVYVNNANSYLLIIHQSVNPSNKCPTDTRVIVKTTNLPSGVSINNIGANVFFASPEPKTCLNSNPTVSSIPFVFSKGGFQKQVTVTKEGRVEVQ